MECDGTAAAFPRGGRSLRSGPRLRLGKGKRWLATALQTKAVALPPHSEKLR